MRSPIVVVTGGIATGKSTVARIFSERGGALIDCDAIGHEALDSDDVKRDVVRRFGRRVLTPSGRVSRVKLGRLVFSDDRLLERLNRIIRPALQGMIRDEVAERRKNARYIVLDAVLFFQYTFRFKVDLVIRTDAPRGVRVGRLVRRDKMARTEALDRVERQEHLERDWRRADMTVRTDVPMPRLRRRVAGIRDRFLESHGLLRGEE